jgi:NADH-quinone oxidoreductase subunit G
VEGAPKLVPACVTPVAEGQVILTESEPAREARMGNLEFYLLNHPLDCPVCDKSGECKLQDYTQAEGRKHGRSLEPKRVLGQDDFGGDILYDGDRCIMCTRCVRFMREISQSDRLGVVQRGNRSVIDTFFDSGVEGDLFAGNIVDICPVGALLSKDFLHKARVWDLDATSSVCSSCSQGCNIRIDTRDNLVMRLRPRLNPEVNSYWMCDYGRRNYEWMNVSDRAALPLQRDVDGENVSVKWQEAILALVDALKDASSPVLLIGSPMLSNEDNGHALRLARALGETEAVFRSVRADDEIVCPGFPKLARRRDLAANVRGLEVLGYRRVGDDDASGGLPDARGRIVITLGDALADAPADYAASARLFIALVHGSSPAVRGASFILPVNTSAESEGTFVNFENRVQRFWAALRAPVQARPAWQVAAVLLAGVTGGTAPADAARAFLALADVNDAFDGLSYEILGTRGALLREAALLEPAGGD